ncbi:hypothetical protein E4N83_04555 [Treponema denticola]|uniref:hypothetical protein n=1 Tax=Treponema denticola TaxID=158 RepID=UPI0020A3569F|nr:hypothetical protein [Treponema denticola]UTC97557.1 hypothetical protein E4N83_04555 [Treponema denticola]
MGYKEELQDLVNIIFTCQKKKKVKQLSLLVYFLAPEFIIFISTILIIFLMLILYSLFGSDYPFIEKLIKIIVGVGYSIDFIIVIIMTLKSYFEATIIKINVKDYIIDNFFIEVEKRNNIFSQLNIIHKQDNSLILKFKRYIINEIKENNINNQLLYGGIQTTSLFTLGFIILNSLDKINELIKGDNQIGLFAVCIPILISYWLYIEKVKQNRMKKIIHYIEEWEKNLTPAST